MARSALAVVFVLYFSGVVAQEAGEQPAETGDDAEVQETTPDQPRVRRLGDSLAVDPTQEWVPSFDPSASTADLGRKLAAAELAMESGDYVTPPQNNALYYFQQVLAQSPENAVALEGVGRVADALVSQARAAQAADDRDTAMARIAEVRTFRPNYPGLRTLEDQVSRRVEIESLLATAAARRDAGQLVEPQGDSALTALEAVLAIEAGNVDAESGIAELREALEAQVRRALDSGSLDEAARGIARIEGVPGSETTVAALQQALADAQAAEREARLTVVEGQVAAGELDAAEAELASLITAGLARSARTAAIADEIARVRRVLAYPAGSTFTDRLAVGGDGPTMVVMPAGSFQMGAARGHRRRSQQEHLRPR